jgi:hypothetical protein
MQPSWVPRIPAVQASISSYCARQTPPPRGTDVRPGCIRTVRRSRCSLTGSMFGPGPSCGGRRDTGSEVRDSPSRHSTTARAPVDCSCQSDTSHIVPHMAVTNLYCSNAFPMTSSDVRVCSCAFLKRPGTSFASRKATMRSLIRAHSSWNGSGASVTRGSENPEAVFIASEGALSPTSEAEGAR